MKTIKLKIKTKTQEYPIIIGSYLTSNISKILRDNSIKFKKTLIVVDKNISKNIVQKIKKSLKNKNIFITFFNASEKNKNQNNVNKILDILLNQNQVDMKREFRTLDSNLRLFRSKSEYLAIIPRFVIEPFAFLLLIVYSLYMTTKGFDAIPSLGVLLFALSKILPYLQSSFGSVALINTYLPSALKAEKMIKEFELIKSGF